MFCPMNFNEKMPHMTPNPINFFGFQSNSHGIYSGAFLSGINEPPPLTRRKIIKIVVKLASMAFIDMATYIVTILNNLTHTLTDIT